ncbi:hypothetical protein PanWU01x14_148080 [Parasponia andersonii]|uniref:Uncharacterized protein n=1 Tax=Parasponia andersonii TaxID=3476 RepID=A0A2P5CIZ7_PARAD|nr:hypothetical protein PanWU01x14_148080 [Parasponia andersonii]
MDSASTKDDSKLGCRFIDLPVDFDRCWRACNRGNIHLGVVRGELGLSQLVKNTNREFILKVWELDCKDINVCWLVILRWGNRNSMFVAAFHPNNGDLIFLLIDHYIYKYKLANSTCPLLYREI